MKAATSILSLALLATAALLLSGCYHTNITTGKPASDQVVEEEWASSFINGLVPPGEISTAEECENGVAQVETKLSFLNMVVGSVTGGLYSPMHIKVTCAASNDMSSAASPQTSRDAPDEMVVEEHATPVEKAEMFDQAAQQAIDTGQPVQVRFE